jgi:hypothetical protein
MLARERKKATPAKWAALTYAIVAAAALGPWLITITSSMPDGQLRFGGAYSMIAYLFSAENENRWWFVGLAVLPVYLIVMSIIYFSPLALKTRWSQGLFVAALVVTAYSLAFVQLLGVALVFALYSSFRAMRSAPRI